MAKKDTSSRNTCFKSNFIVTSLKNFRRCMPFKLEILKVYMIQNLNYS